ncbi:flagellar hook-associated protein 2 [Cytobacillus sp. IB215665]|uniref:flagellar hook-associated protein 2 n=1 Tax=Cytobacillus sp. IB215665 TaxID=3097357 RepID=UPI002A13D26D|nr:flagellar hook-associated protein 2 [Cytobacillus sp. IB215665]MDX8363827.1 flagellar hook-associated protein 2 [Cytobacillus sp. IB215665]
MVDLRIGGLASGMDIDQIVSDLMSAERIPLDKLSQKKQILEWQRDSYREMNTLLKELDTFIFDGIDRQSNLLKKTTTSSNENIVTAVANADASDVSTEIEVLNIAKSATWISNEAANFTGGQAVTLTLDVTNGDGTKSEGVTIDIADTDTLDDVIRKLNENEQLGINVFYDSETEKVVMTKEETGSQAGLEVVDSDTQRFFAQLGFTDPDAIKTDGEDAEFIINGLQTTRSTNEFSINNVSYTLHNESPGEKIRVSTSTDDDAIVDTVVQFVNKYNEIIEKINSTISEEKYRDYPPLTDAEREELSDDEIEKWEGLAKSGILKGDSTLSSVLNQMRLDLYSPISGSETGFSQLAEIGITTSADYTENGKLLIDEDKLREKIAENPEAVYELFNAEGDSYETSGIASRLRDSLDNAMTQIVEKAGSSTKTNDQFSIGKSLDNVLDDILNFENRLEMVEDRYWSQFTAMELAIQKANEQAAYLASQFGY